MAKYTVEAGAATQDVVLDQTAVDGWQSLGEFEFEAGVYQRVHLGDNTGELLANNVQMVFDGVRVTRVDTGTGGGSDELDPPPGDESSGCNAGGSGAGAGLLLAVSVLGLVIRRRRH
jgi:uncharacterized protein (TIGR03382 family)